MGGMALCKSERIEDLEIKVRGVWSWGYRREKGGFISPRPPCGEWPMPGLGITTSWPVEHHWSSEGHGATQRQKEWEMAGETLLFPSWWGSQADPCLLRFVTSRSVFCLIVHWGGKFSRSGER